MIRTLCHFVSDLHTWIQTGSGQQLNMDLIRRATGPYTSVEDSVLNLCFTIFRTVEKVKVNRERCHQISDRVKSLERLVLTIKQKGPGQNSAMVEATLRELCITLDSVATEMEKLSQANALMNALKSKSQEDKFWKMDRTLTDILHVLSGTLNIEQGNALYRTPLPPRSPMAPAPIHNPRPMPPVKKSIPPAALPPITKCSPPTFMNNPSPVPTVDMCDPPGYTPSSMPSTTMCNPPEYTPSPMAPTVMCNPPAPMINPSPMPSTTMCNPPEYNPSPMPPATIGDPPAYTPSPMASTNTCNPPAAMINPSPIAPTETCSPSATTYYASPMAPTVMCNPPAPMINPSPMAPTVMCNPPATTYYASPMAPTVMCNPPATTYYTSPMAPMVMCSPQATTYYTSPMAPTVTCNPPAPMPSYRPLVMGTIAPRLFSPKATVISLKTNFGYSS
ncbi:uncharacterized protein LOC144521819 [Sander vitreus]